MYELKKNGKIFTSKFVVTGLSSYKKIIYQAAVSQRLRNTVQNDLSIAVPNKSLYLSNINISIVCHKYFKIKGRYGKLTTTYCHPLAY